MKFTMTEYGRIHNSITNTKGVFIRLEYEENDETYAQNLIYMNGKYQLGSTEIWYWEQNVWQSEKKKEGILDEILTNRIMSIAKGVIEYHQDWLKG